MEHITKLVMCIPSVTQKRWLSTEEEYIFLWEEISDTEEFFCGRPEEDYIFYKKKNRDSFAVDIWLPWTGYVDVWLLWCLYTRVTCVSKKRTISQDSEHNLLTMKI